VKGFFDTFKANQKAYEEINPSAMEQLYGFIDFAQFKLILVDYKTMKDE